MPGSIRKRGDNRWEITLDLGRTHDGKRRRKYLTVKGSKSDAQRRMRQLLTSLDQGLPLPDSKVTLRAFLEHWLQSHSSKVRDRTIYGYRNVLNGYVVPRLGASLISSVRPSEIDALYTSLLKCGLSPRTVLQTHRILKKALKQAVRWNLIPRNPADMVDPPKFEGKEFPTLSSEQLQTLLRAAAETPFGMALFLAAYSGMRRGELAGLKWTDIDFDGGMISVNRELIFIPKRGYQVTPPKSSKSRRAVDVTPNVIAELRRHRAAQAEQQLRLGSAWNDEDWVIANEDGTHVNPNAITKEFKELRTKLGLPPVRFHDLRHTHATLLLRAGVHLKVVQERLGHSTIAITADTYSHVTAGLQKAAALAFESLLEGADSAPAETPA